MLFRGTFDRAGPVRAGLDDATAIHTTTPFAHDLPNLALMARSLGATIGVSLSNAREGTSGNALDFLLPERSYNM